MLHSGRSARRPRAARSREPMNTSSLHARRSRVPARQSRSGLRAGVWTVVAAGLIVVACGGPERVPVDPDTALAPTFFGDGFSLRPPVGWEINRRGTAVEFRPAADDADRSSQARIRIVRTQRDLAYASNGLFHAAIVTTLGERSETAGIEQEQWVADAPEPYSLVQLVEASDDDDTETRYHFRNYRIGRRGYVAVAAIASVEGWDRLELLLIASLSTFRTGARDAPP